METLNWIQANPFAISFDKTLETWNAGHVNDILAIGTSIVVASDTGGAWLINQGPSNQYPAICMSNDWTDVNMSCLAFGPDADTQIFAGCWSTSTIYAVNLQIENGAVNFLNSTRIPLPSGAGGVNKIVVQKNPRRIIVACANGVLWSAIPNQFDQVEGYQWQEASNLPSGGFTGLTPGTDTNVVTAAWGSNVSTGLFGIFVGTWNPTFSDLSFTRANIAGSDASKMLRTSIASCAVDRSVMYAVSAGSNDTIFNVLRSQDGGRNWTTINIPANPGNQGWYNNCIDVNPLNSQVVAIGWRGGPFVSSDGGNSWNTLSGNGLHSDLHAVYFPGFGDATTLFVGSDGGVVLLSQGRSNSMYNMYLLNLQFYGGDGTAFPGLYSVGTQDNGNITSMVDSTVAPWTQLEGGDGGVNRFLHTGQLLRYNNTLNLNGVEVGNRVRVDAWDPSGHTFPGGLGKVINVDNTSDGLPYPVLEIVNVPQFVRNNQLMFALGGGRDTDTGTNQRLYGLFADPSGDNMHWSLIAAVNENITSLGSFNGYQIIIGTDKGQILACDTATGTITPMPMTQNINGLTGSINQLLVQNGIYDPTNPSEGLTMMFALHSAGFVLKYDGSAWDILPGLPQQQYVAIETERSVDVIRPPGSAPKVLYLATDSTVMSSADNGQTWSLETQGLPASPHCTDLRFVIEPDKSKYLYLGTYGRSLWRAQIAPPPPPPGPKPPFVNQILRILAGVIQDGGGWTTGGPVPPLGPENILLIGLAATSLAQTVYGTRANTHMVESMQLLTLAAQTLRAGQRTRGLDEQDRDGHVSFEQIMDLIERFQEDAHPDHELAAGILAASLARRHGGEDGNKGLDQALRFISQHARQRIAPQQTREDGGKS
ncbi:WD40/YVTN/BNR-like repeat-containing protein [Bacillus cereus]|uniref:WD40/YVTN/BNR-like repeat-containing protein n=1 Tax=Bacillus cereus TaxID=1396 RepID=UPI000BF88CC1|nr:hypothetical protein [Bacillus cereus]PEY75485.1 hypothetical protein CN344_22490 [Bacillus cereus]PGP75233.1 hypothetical protein CN999_31115 [Bacillus cereus]